MQVLLWHLPRPCCLGHVWGTTITVLRCWLCTTAPPPSAVPYPHGICGKPGAESIPDRTCYAFQPQHVLAQQTHHRSWNPAGARLSVFISASSDVLSECGVITRINKQQSSWQTTNPLVCPVLGGLVLFVFVWRCHSFLIGSVCPLLSLSYRVLYVISSAWAANWIPDLLDLNVDSRHDRPEIL